MNFKKTFISSVATFTLFVNASLPTLATTIEISGNGTDSTNKVYVDQETTVGVTQTNYAAISNSVNLYADTGKNEAEDNTGGDIKIDTGDAEATATVTNMVNSNQAEVECCASKGVDVLISGNGSETYNKVDVDSGEKQGVYVTQDNKAMVENHVDAYAKTGSNEAEDNTGGDVSIETGDATVDVTVGTTANYNSAVVSGDGEGGGLSAMIVGNGTDSKNKIYLDLDSELLIVQSNYAAVHNDVDAYAKTGKNEAEDNTGGETFIDTGDAKATVEVENLVNFNWASMDCDCLLSDYLLKVAGNGEDTYNKIKLDLGGGMWATQGNIAGSGLQNEIDVAAKTGSNEVEDGTGSVDGDPAIETGDAVVGATVENSGNSNVVGEFPSFEWPDFDDMEFHFGFNWAAMFAWMGMHFDA